MILLDVRTGQCHGAPRGGGSGCSRHPSQLPAGRPGSASRGDQAPGVAADVEVSVASGVALVVALGVGSGVVSGVASTDGVGVGVGVAVVVVSVVSAESVDVSSEEALSDSSLAEAIRVTVVPEPPSRL